MTLDPLERQHLRQKMARRMAAFLGNSRAVDCVSAHWHEEPQFCELSQENSDNEILVIKNRAGKKMKVAVSSLRDMVRFQVVEANDFERWLAKLPELKAEAIKRNESAAQAREDERKRLEKRFIVRKKPPGNGAP